MDLEMLPLFIVCGQLAEVCGHGARQSKAGGTDSGAKEQE
jgi:hypothetical protein